MEILENADAFAGCYTPTRAKHALVEPVSARALVAALPRGGERAHASRARVSTRERSISAPHVLRRRATRGGDARRRSPPSRRSAAEETCGGASHRERAAPPARAAARTRRTALDESIASFASKKSSRASPPRRSSRSVGRDAPERKSLRIGVHHANGVVWEPVWRRSLVARALVLATCVLVLAGAVPPVGAGLEKHQYMGAGLQHTCVVLDDGRAACWGEAGSGKLLGSGGPDGTCDFGTVDGTDGGPILTVKSVSVGYEHSCAVLSNDRVKCWGRQTSTGNRLGCGSDCNWNSQRWCWEQLSVREICNATQHPLSWRRRLSPEPSTRARSRRVMNCIAGERMTTGKPTSLSTAYLHRMSDG